MLNEANLKFVKEAVSEWRAMAKGREWKSWMKIAAALQIGANDVMKELQINERKGKVYSLAFSKWCNTFGFSNPEIPATIRSYLLYLVEPENRMICEELR